MTNRIKRMNTSVPIPMYMGPPLVVPPFPTDPTAKQRRAIWRPHGIARDTAGERVDSHVTVGEGNGMPDGIDVLKQDQREIEQLFRAVGRGPQPSGAPGNCA